MSIKYLFLLGLLFFNLDAFTQSWEKCQSDDIDQSINVSGPKDKPVLVTEHDIKQICTPNAGDIFGGVTCYQDLTFDGTDKFILSNGIYYIYDGDLSLTNKIGFRTNINTDAACTDKIRFTIDDYNSVASSPTLFFCTVGEPDEITFSFNIKQKGSEIVLKKYRTLHGCSPTIFCGGTHSEDPPTTYNICPLNGASVAIGSIATSSYVYELNNPDPSKGVSINVGFSQGSYCGNIEYVKYKLTKGDANGAFADVPSQSVPWASPTNDGWSDWVDATISFSFTSNSTGVYRLEAQTKEHDYNGGATSDAIIHTTQIHTDFTVQYSCANGSRTTVAPTISLTPNNTVLPNGITVPSNNADPANAPVTSDNPPVLGTDAAYLVIKDKYYDLEFQSDVKGLNGFYEMKINDGNSTTYPFTSGGEIDLTPPVFNLSASYLIIPFINRYDLISLDEQNRSGNFECFYISSSGCTEILAPAPNNGNATFYNNKLIPVTNGNYNCPTVNNLSCTVAPLVWDPATSKYKNSGNTQRNNVNYKYVIPGLKVTEDIAAYMLTFQPVAGFTPCTGNTLGHCCPVNAVSGSTGQSFQIRITVGGADINFSTDPACPTYTDPAKKCTYCPKCVCSVEIPSAFIEKTSTGATNPDFILSSGHGFVDGEDQIKVFVWKIASNRSVIVRENIQLGEGAILSVDDPRVPGTASDLNIIDGDLSPANVAQQNYIESITYDDYRNILGHSRSYFDTKGELTQTQVKLLNGNGPYGIVLASQTVQDKYGRIALQTLPAPIKHASQQTVSVGTNTADNCAINKTESLPPTQGLVDPYKLQRGEAATFGYDASFIKDNAGTAFDFNDLTSTASLGILSKTASHVGWYYSDLNINNPATSTVGDQVTSEPYTPVSGYPYTQTIYKEDGTNEVMAVVPPGDAYRAASANSSFDGNYVQNLAKSEILKMPLPGTDGTFTAAAADGSYYFNVSNNNGSNASSNARLLKVYLALLRVYIPGVADASVTEDQYAAKLYRKKLTDQAGHISYMILNERDMPLITEKYIYDATGAYTNSEYAFNYYDLKGRLITSVSPNGVAAFYTSRCTTNVCSGTDNSADIDRSQYTYDFEGRLITSQDNDRGLTEFKYRKDGRLRFSRNAVQASSSKFSYTNYDRLGRIAESGEFDETSTSTDYVFKKVAASPTNSIDIDAILENTDVTASWSGLSASSGGLQTPAMSNRVITFYNGDERDYVIYNFPSALGTRDETFLQGKVSASVKVGVASTWYGYDDRGRLTLLVQNISGLGAKKVEYKYNANGGVSEVWYQDGAANADRYYHYYKYDYDGRLVRVFAGQIKPVHGYAAQLDSVTNESSLTKIADYSYYLHGPLKSLATGPGGGQHIDYLYTIEGWLKSINYPAPNADPGKNTNDLFSMAMEYYSGDYAKTSGVGSNITSLKLNTGESIYTGNFNGIPRVITWMNNAVDPGVTKAYQYSYDSKYQLTASTRVGLLQYTGGNPQFPFNTLIQALVPDKFNETFNYDKNGNMTALTRSDENGTSLNNLSMTYAANTNRLMAAGAYASTYTYDAKGQTTGISGGTFNNGKAHAITYDPFGMVTNVQQNSINSSDYSYDASGQRVYKKIYNAAGTAAANEEYYVRDAQGNMLATYAKAASATAPTLEEIPVYGASKLGVNYFATGGDEGIAYELKDHLGNVRAVIGYYGSTTPYGQDYYAYGGEMGHSNFTHSLAVIHNRQRYQGDNSEKDEETSLNHFEARDYDPVIGRWLSIDPAHQNWSGYLGMGNNPMLYTDNDGRTIIIKNGATEHISGSVNPSTDPNINAVIGELTYLKRHPEVKAIIEFMEKSKEFTLTINANSKGANEFEPNTAYQGIIYHNINGYTSVHDDNGTPTGKYRSPFNSLWHEFGHFISFMSNKEMYLYGGKAAMGKWTNFEEGSNIILRENPIMKFFNEPLRTNHYGTLYTNNYTPSYAPIVGAPKENATELNLK